MRLKLHSAPRAKREWSPSAIHLLATAKLPQVSRHEGGVRLRYGGLLLAALLTFAVSASAHVLKAGRAHDTSKKLAASTCKTVEAEEPSLLCKGSGVDRCRRLSAHRVQCHSHILSLVSGMVPDSGSWIKCSWWDDWSLRQGSGRMYSNQKTVDRTLRCVDVTCIYNPSFPCSPDRKRLPEVSLSGVEVEMRVFAAYWARASAD